jgi:hypothetical protein
MDLNRIIIVIAATPSSEQCERMEHVDAEFGRVRDALTKA